MGFLASFYLGHFRLLDRGASDLVNDADQLVAGEAALKGDQPIDLERAQRLYVGDPNDNRGRVNRLDASERLFVGEIEDAHAGVPVM
ncbi:hypothetical protein [Qipengyuania sp. YIM B01966]|uniref:hypothetical protein n=1 Tax=Qipengyuania sp. YIM B01966 TaxID=2778646 RepID=UPI0018F3563A|nr:hypothetical protein [Qipengyuania sp. YIM B01966]